MLRKILTIIALVCLVTYVQAAWGSGQTTDDVCRSAPEGLCTSTPDGPGSKQMCCELVFDSLPKTYVGSGATNTPIDLYDRNTGIKNIGQRGLQISSGETGAITQQGKTVFCYKKHGNIEFARYLSNPNVVFSEVYVKPTLQNSPFNRPSSVNTWKIPLKDADTIDAYGEATTEIGKYNAHPYTGREYAMKQPFKHPQSRLDGITHIDYMGTQFWDFTQDSDNGGQLWTSTAYAEGGDGTTHAHLDHLDYNTNMDYNGGSNGATNPIPAGAGNIPPTMQAECMGVTTNVDAQEPMTQGANQCFIQFHHAGLDKTTLNQITATEQGNQYIIANVPGVKLAANGGKYEGTGGNTNLAPTVEGFLFDSGAAVGANNQFYTGSDLAVDGRINRDRVDKRQYIRRQCSQINGWVQIGDADENFLPAASLNANKIDQITQLPVGGLNTAVADTAFTTDTAGAKTAETGAWRLPFAGGYSDTYPFSDTPLDCHDNTAITTPEHVRTCQGPFSNIFGYTGKGHGVSDGTYQGMPDFATYDMYHYGETPRKAVLDGNAPGATLTAPTNIEGKFIAHPDELPVQSGGNVAVSDSVGIAYESLIPQQLNKNTNMMYWCNSMVGWGLPYKFSTGNTMGTCANPDNYPLANTRTSTTGKKVNAALTIEARSSWCPLKATVPEDSATPLPCFVPEAHTAAKHKYGVGVGGVTAGQAYDPLNSNTWPGGDPRSRDDDDQTTFTDRPVALDARYCNPNAFTPQERADFPRMWTNYDPRVKNKNGMNEVPFSPVPNSLSTTHPGYEVVQVPGDQFCSSVNSELSATIVWGTSHKPDVLSETTSDNEFKFSGTTSSCSCNVNLSNSMFMMSGLTLMSILITLWNGW